MKKKKKGRDAKEATGGDRRADQETIPSLSLVLVSRVRRSTCDHLIFPRLAPPFDALLASIPSACTLTHLLVTLVTPTTMSADDK